MTTLREQAEGWARRVRTKQVKGLSEESFDSWLVGARAALEAAKAKHWCGSNFVVHVADIDALLKGLEESDGTDPYGGEEAGHDQVHEERREEMERAMASEQPKPLSAEEIEEFRAYWKDAPDDAAKSNNARIFATLAERDREAAAAYAKLADAMSWARLMGKDAGPVDRVGEGLLLAAATAVAERLAERDREIKNLAAEAANLRSVADRRLGWLQWRTDWTGADGPHGPDGTPWYEDALGGAFHPTGYPRLEESDA